MLKPKKSLPVVDWYLVLRYQVEMELIFSRLIHGFPSKKKTLQAITE
jgi:hypothetical protein